MDPETIRHCMSFGFSDKKTKYSIGQCMNTILLTCFPKATNHSYQLKLTINTRNNLYFLASTILGKKIFNERGESICALVEGQWGSSRENCFKNRYDKIKHLVPTKSQENGAVN